MSSSKEHSYPGQGVSVSESEAELHARALARLKAKRDLRGHIVVYIAVNLMLVVLWWTGGGGFFWPIFPVLGWGIGLALNIWNVMSPSPNSNAVRAEMDRLRRQ